DKVGQAAFAPTESAAGHLIYWNNGALFGVPFDLSRLAVGSPSPVAEGVAGILNFGFFGFSDSGTLAYVPGTANGTAFGGSLAPARTDRLGAEQSLAVPPGLYANVYAGGLQLSPDGKQVGLSSLDLGTASADVWVYDFARTTMNKLTFGGGH